MEVALLSDAARGVPGFVRSCCACINPALCENRLLIQH